MALPNLGQLIVASVRRAARSPSPYPPELYGVNRLCHPVGVEVIFIQLAQQIALGSWAFDVPRRAP